MSFLDAAVAWTNGKIYFFKAKMYIRYDIKADRADPGYPNPIIPNWPGLPIAMIPTDAVITWPNGKAYFFKGNQYCRYDIKADRADVGYPKPIKGNWPGVWEDGVDAAVTWINGKTYFFKGDQYVRYDIKEDRADPGYPKSIKANWPGLWERDIDAVIVWSNEKAFFFKGDQYIRYDIRADRADPAYPKPIFGPNWPAFDWNGTGHAPPPGTPGTPAKKSGTRRITMLTNGSINGFHSDNSDLELVGIGKKTKIVWIKNCESMYGINLEHIDEDNIKIGDIPHDRICIDPLTATNSIPIVTWGGTWDAIVYGNHGIPNSVTIEIAWEER